MTRRLLAVSLTAFALTLIGTAALLGLRTPPPAAPQESSVPPHAVAGVAVESAAPAPAHEVSTLAIRRRDTVVAALLRADVAPATAHDIAAALQLAGANLRQVQAGDELLLARDTSGRLVLVAYEASPWVRFEVTDSGGAWQARRTESEPEVRVEVRQARVQRSLWDAVESGALAPAVLLDLVQIFESEFDFTADTRAGDQLRLLVETRYAQGVAIDHGRILAAQYVSGGRTLTGVGFAGADRFAYYDPDGSSLKKMFLRSPLPFTRISSGFTYRRPHPVLGGLRPHLAIDYAAPTGTPVWAVADGVVLLAGRKGGNGIQVRLRHAGGYETYYNHLSRVAQGVRDGVRVVQKQVIGFVGATGLATGPHLDYRVAHRGRFVNPLDEKFLPGEPIAQSERASFQQRAGELVARLEREAPFQL